jgi:nicotinate phosphoribosyltransferase
MTLDPAASGLLTDLYQFTMVQGYLEAGLTQEAVFELFIRKLPQERNFLIAAGLEQLLDTVESLRYGEADLEVLARAGFGDELLDYLRSFHFTGQVHAVPEGTICFGQEPLVRITAPLPAAQLLETRAINLVQFQTMIAAKAARMVLTAPGKQLVDFGLRRAHGAEAGLLSARASYLVGFAGTSNVLAHQLWNLPMFGTMAHAFVEAHDDEEQAFLAFARANPREVVFILDSYDTLRAARKVVALAPRLKAEGISIRGVRLDSGDLAALARGVRQSLDAGGLADARIVASGNLDEFSLTKLVDAGAPIDGFGIGTQLAASADAPTLECVYKLQQFAGRPRRKRSAGKATWPGAKQVFRHRDREGRWTHDVITLDGAPSAGGDPLLQEVMRDGRRIAPSPSLDAIRRHAADQLQQLPMALRALDRQADYRVEIGQQLVDLAAQFDAEHRQG